MEAITRYEELKKISGAITLEESNPLLEISPLLTKRAKIAKILLQATGEQWEIAKREYDYTNKCIKEILCL